MFGDDPAGYHVVNVLLHAVACVLVFVVLRRIEVPGAGVAALLFAVHPVNAATVVWISELKNILSLIFLCATATAWLEFERTRRWRSFVIALAAYAVALCSKTSVATWPAMMLGFSLWRRGRLTRRDIIESLPFWVLAAALSAMTVLVQGRILDVLSRPLVGWEKAAGAGWIFWFYVEKALAPVNLSAVYPHWKTAIEALGWVALVPTSVLAALTSSPG